MIRFKGRKQLPMTKRIIYIPLIAIAIGFFAIGYFAIVSAKTSLTEQMSQQASGISHQMAARIRDHRQALTVIDGLLEEKVKLIGTAVSANRSSFTHFQLREFAERFSLEEINWFSQSGTIKESSITKYKGWVAPEGHPVKTFLEKDVDLWSEPIHKDSESNRYNKYGYYRLRSGEFLQIALPADEVQNLTVQFTEEHLVKLLSEDSGVVHAAFFDGAFNTVALEKSKKFRRDSQIENLIPGSLLSSDSWDLLRLGQVVSGEVLPGKVYEVYVPVIDKGLVEGYLCIGFDMAIVEKVIAKTAGEVFIMCLLTLLSIALTMEMLLKKYVAKPIEDLAADMELIHIERDTSYRLPNRQSDPFSGLRTITNQVLKITHSYFDEIIAHQEELIAANEELKAQYDEIEAYAFRMNQLKQHFTIAIEATGCYIWELDCLTSEMLISDNLMTFFGLETDVLSLTDLLLEYVHPEDRVLMEDCLSEMTTPLLTGSEPIHFHVRIKSPNGDWRWYLMRGSMAGSSPGDLPQLAGVLVDIDHQKEQEIYIQYLADHDTLTGLYSRRKYQDVVAKAIEQGKTGTVLLMDIDNFKNINDYYGHVYGDKVLKHFAQLLKQHMWENSQVFRLGGDEFIIHVEGTVPVERVIHQLKAFVSWMEEHQVIDGFEQRLTVSTGIAQYPMDARKVDELLMKVDLAMYDSKKSGKNRFSCYNDSLKEVLGHRLNVENHLRNALATEGFTLHYQPVIEVSLSEVGYFEALIRLKDNAYSPADLIGIAEESGLIHAIGRWVIKEVVEQQVRWRTLGLKLKPVAINLSPRQMVDSQLVPYIASLINQYELEPNLLEIEITENILVENRTENLLILEEIRKLGLTIALDDFGTGYSSLNYLTFIPVDKIKLDKSLKDKFIDLESIQVMDSLISLAHGLQLKVVAEGVETHQESRRLINGGCDYLQGYHFSRPLTAADAQLWIEQPLLGDREFLCSKVSPAVEREEESIS